MVLNNNDTKDALISKYVVQTYFIKHRGGKKPQTTETHSQ